LIEKLNLFRLEDYENPDNVFLYDLCLNLKISLTNLKLNKRDINKYLSKKSSNFKFSENFIDDYRQLFAGKKPGAQGTIDEVIKNMSEFVKTYPEYTEEDILNATRKYIESCTDFTYLQKAHYFIFKKDFTTNIRKSNLLTYLEFTEPNYNLNYVE